MAAYPPTVPTATGTSVPVTDFNVLADAVRSIIAELGANPSAEKPTVQDKFNQVIWDAAVARLNGDNAEAAARQSADTAEVAARDAAITNLHATITAEIVAAVADKVTQAVVDAAVAELQTKVNAGIAAFDAAV